MNEAPSPPISASFSLRQAFFEAFFVLLGVVLAWSANAWWANRAQAERASVALHAIETEMRTNLDAVRSALTYHEGLLEGLRARTPESPPLSPGGFPRGFIAPAPMLRAAWDTAQTTGALEKVAYARLLDTARLYAAQRRYEQQASSVGQIIYETMLARGTSGVLAESDNLAAIIATFYYRERRLTALFEETLTGLEKAP